MKVHNNMCSGGHCRCEHGEVRVFPIGGSGNMILCIHCWRHENLYRRDRGRETHRPEDFPQLDWSQAEIYDPGETWTSSNKS